MNITPERLELYTELTGHDAPTWVRNWTPVEFDHWKASYIASALDNGIDLEESTNHTDRDIDTMYDCNSYSIGNSSGLF